MGSNVRTIGWFIAGCTSTAAVCIFVGAGQPPAPVTQTLRDKLDRVQEERAERARVSKLFDEWAGKKLPDGTTVPTMEELQETVAQDRVKALESAEALVDHRSPVMCAFASGDKILVISPAGPGFVVDASGAAKLVTAPSSLSDPHDVNFRWGSVDDSAGDLVRAILTWCHKIDAATKPPPPRGTP